MSNVYWVCFDTFNFGSNFHLGSKKMVEEIPEKVFFWWENIRLTTLAYYNISVERLLLVTCAYKW